jgi:hypothetical protein
VEGLYELEIIELQDTCDPRLEQPSYIGRRTNVPVQRRPEFTMMAANFFIDFKNKPVSAQASIMHLEFSGTIEEKVSYSNTSITIHVVQNWKMPPYAHYFAKPRTDCVADHIYRFQLQQPCSGACLESPPPTQITPSPGRNGLPSIPDRRPH